jgi:hypothetical protein
MNIASARNLDLEFVGDETWLYLRDHNHVVIPKKSPQNTSSCAPTHTMLSVVLLAAKVSEKVLADLEAFQEEMGVMNVGKIGVMRNVVAHSKGLNLLDRAQNWTEKH